MCFSGPGIYDRKKLNETYGIKDVSKYIKFLTGDLWDDKMVGVKYDDVTFDIKDPVFGVLIMGMDGIGHHLYTWFKNNAGGNDTTKNSETSSYLAHSIPIRTTYRRHDTKCFTLDLTVEAIPNIQGQLINSVGIIFKALRIPDVSIYYGISYPGQILRAFLLDAELYWNHRITLGQVKSKLFLFDSIEVFRKRSTIARPCKGTWRDDDDTIMRDVIEMANCKPPHWNISTRYPICNTKEKMKNVTIPYSAFKIATPTFLKQFKQPCHGLQAATLNTIVEQRKNFSSLTPTYGMDVTSMGFHFKNEQYKEIKYTEAFDFESLVGKIGGHIGLLLGFAFWQIPDAMKFLRKKLRAMVAGKILQ